MARVFVLDVNNDSVRIADCNELDDFYRELQAEPFNIVSTRVGGIEFDVFIDDIGLFREDQIISAINEAFRPQLVGNLIFAHHDSSGKTTDVSDEDIEVLNDHLITVYDVDAERGNQAMIFDL